MDQSKSKVLYRSFTGDMPIMKHGIGSLLFDSKDNHYIDLSSSACTAILGHNNKYVTNRIYDQMGHVPNVFGGFWATDIAEHAGELLCKHMDPDWFGRVHFLNGGGEAVDLACKLAYQYHAEAGNRRFYYCAIDHAFHGVGTLPFSLTGYYPRYRMIGNYHDSMVGEHVQHAEHPYNVADERALKSMEACLADGRVAAVIVEPVGGPPLGAFAHSIRYLQGLRDICDEYGALLIFDEILCGSGRCGYMSVKDMYGVQPDIVLLGKGLSAGYVPMSAIVISKKVEERLAKGSGSIMFGTANSNHSAGCAAVVGTIEYMQSHKLFERVRADAGKLRKTTETYMDLVPGVGEIRSQGFLLGIELRNPSSLDYLPAELGFHAVARKCIYDRGVIVYTKGQTMNGVGDFITIAPPAEITTIRFEEAIARVAEGLRDAYNLVKGKY